MTVVLDYLMLVSAALALLGLCVAAWWQVWLDRATVLLDEPVESSCWLDDLGTDWRWPK